MSVVIHEISHGFMARSRGDNTAYIAGRLTLNPLSHLDLFGSIILPAVLIITKAPFLVGWAKPVPYNPFYLKNRKWDEIAIASAGILANIFLALFFGLLIRFAPLLLGIPPYDPLSLHPFYAITIMIVSVNLGLAVFNLLPFPPLDGSKIFINLLPRNIQRAIDSLGTYSLIFIIIFIVFFSSVLSPVIHFLFQLITGLQI